jgi:hypothetical protein
MTRPHFTTLGHVVIASSCMALLLGCCGKPTQVKRTPAKAVTVEKAATKSAPLKEVAAKPAPTQPSETKPANCASFDGCILACPDGATLEKDAAARRVACKRGGKMYGEEVVWHDNGKKKLSSTWVDGKKQGLVATWHENGSKHLEGTKNEGMADGTWRSWHSNGQKASESVWKADKRLSGQCWDRKGVACKETQCLKEGGCK